MFILIFILMLFAPIQAQTNLHTYDVKNIDAPFKIFLTGRIEKILDNEIGIDSVFDVFIDSNRVETIDVEIKNQVIIEEFAKWEIFVNNKKNVTFRFKWQINDSTVCYFIKNRISVVEQHGFLVLFVNGKISSCLRANANIHYNYSGNAKTIQISTLVLDSNNIVVKKNFYYREIKENREEHPFQIKRYQIINGKFVEKKI